MNDRGLNFAKLPTIVDVARLAGVSKSTVSNVIRNADCVKPEMRARVVEAITTIAPLRRNVELKMVIRDSTAAPRR